jgi:hypothetical protein
VQNVVRAIKTETDIAISNWQDTSHLYNKLYDLSSVCPSAPNSIRTFKTKRYRAMSR